MCAHPRAIGVDCYLIQIGLASLLDPAPAGSFFGKRNMNWRTWEALACRHAAYRDVLSKRIGDLPDHRRFDALAGRQRNHDARMRRHLDKALTLSDRFPT